MTKNFVTKEIILKALEISEIECDITDFNMTFDEVGFDSMDIINFFMELETLTGHGIEDEDLDKFKTLNDVLNNYYSV